MGDHQFQNLIYSTLYHFLTPALLTVKSNCMYDLLAPDNFPWMYIISVSIDCQFCEGERFIDLVVNNNCSNLETWVVSTV